MSDERITAPPRMSLWQIDEGLAAMVEYRQQRCDDPEAPPDAEELAAIDGQIAMYMEALPRKVDSTAGVFRWWFAQLDTILGPKDAKGTRRGGEVDRLKGMAKAIEGQIERLKECCAVVLEKQPLPAKGSRALSGTTSKILLKTNGGLEPLVITDHTMLPDDVLRAEVSMSFDLWKRLTSFIAANQWDMWVEIDRTVQSKVVPDNTRIRVVLAGPCAACDGDGRAKIGWRVECTVCHRTKSPRGRSAPLEMANFLCDLECPGYSTAPDPGSLWPQEEAHSGMTGPVCGNCGGTGKAAVPGAHLEPRGQHVEIR